MEPFPFNSENFNESILCVYKELFQKIKKLFSFSLYLKKTCSNTRIRKAATVKNKNKEY